MNAQLIDKLLYCSCMFRHYCVILRELIVEYIQGQYNDSIMQIVYTVTIQDFMRTVTTKLCLPFYYK